MSKTRAFSACGGSVTLFAFARCAGDGASRACPPLAGTHWVIRLRSRFGGQARLAPKVSLRDSLPLSGHQEERGTLGFDFSLGHPNTPIN
ncbi:MAG: hypothetical protein HYU99_07725 [Deltaproteobacteria bacterium]|nr:hypothetical protein [Deltaproteobacteria bacterium]